MSEWIGFNLSMFPDKCIINKQLPGCGFTEYLLRSNEDIIVPVPRKVLGKNKYEQHKGEVYLVRNEMDKDISTDKDISKDVKDYSKVPTEEELQKQMQEREKKNNEIYQRLYNEIVEYITIRRNNNLPSKILVTYDSYRIVYQILNSLGIFHNFYVVVDEFQSILHDSRFKSTTENRFLKYLRQSSRTIFLSATPMLDDYLEMLSDFKDLPYYTLDWEKLNPGRVERPHLDSKTMKSVGTKAKEILEDFLAGKYKFTVRPDGNIVYSTEIVFYVNSINHIISIIKNNNLTPEQVNIICAINDDNRKKIQKKLGKKFDIGSIPLKGEKAKSITLCTRTAYLGVDFYSKTATTYIFSDANVDSLAVDISEDLSQILGRLRDEENPWFNCAFFFYRITADYRKMREEDGYSDFHLSSADDFKRRELAIMYGERKDLDWFLEKERSVFHAKWEEEFLSVRMFPGMADFLRDLKKVVPVAFLTDFPVGTKLKAMGIEDVPQFVICSEDIGHLKPSRLPFRLLSERLSLNAEEILYVGDSEKKDVLGARNAGMKSLLITKDARKAKKSAADLVVSSYAEMREKLL